ncbi:MAG: alpha/beta fold hydrolase [Succinivibrionaceae bacterium]
MKIVFIHGFMGNPKEFFPIALNLPIKSEIITLPYHGCSDCFIDFSNINDWLDEQLLSLKIKDCIIYGYSLGGRIVYNYLLNNKKPKCRVHGAIIESSNYGLINQKEIQEREKIDTKWSESFLNKPIIDVLKDWYNQPIFNSLSLEDKQKLINNKKNLNPINMAKAITNLSVSKMPYYKPLLKELNKKLLYIYGENDEKYKTLSKELNLLNNKNIKTISISNASHNCHFEQLSTVSKIINEFIQDILNEKK